MVRAVEDAEVRPLVGLDLKAVLLRSRLHRRPGGRPIRAGDDHRLRYAERQDHVEVEIQRRFAQRNERLMGIVLGAQQPFLLRSDGEEDGRSLRLWRLSRPGAGQLEEKGAASSIVSR